MWRIVERFPNWVKTPVGFYDLDIETQAMLRVYEAIRESEEVLLKR